MRKRILAIEATVVFAAMAIGVAMLGAKAQAPAAISPSGFAAVAKHLDQGGDFYLYINLKDALRDVVAQIQETIMSQQGLPPQVQMIPPIVNNGIELLGLYGIEDVGISVARMEGGLRRTKVFVRSPGDRTGLFRILGGEPHAFDMLELAPPDTALFRYVEVDPVATLEIMRTAAQQWGGVAGLTALNTQIANASVQSGINIEQAIRSFKGHLALITDIDKVSMWTAPMDGQPGPALPTPRATMCLQVADDSIYNALLLLIRKGGELEESTGADGFRRAIIKMEQDKEGPKFSPVIGYGDGRLFLSSHTEHLDTILATLKGGESLASHADFQGLMSCLPEQGNGLFYLSPDAMTTANDVVHSVLDAIAASQANRQGRGMDQGPKTMINMIVTLLDSVPPSGMAMVRGNGPDGLHMTSVSPEGPFDMAALGGLFSLAPTLLGARTVRMAPNTRAAVARTKADQRSMATAVEAYTIDWGRCPLSETGDKSINKADVPSLALISGAPSITTPVAYIMGVPKDPFSKEDKALSYYSTKNGWIMWSTGPDRDHDLTAGNITMLYSPTVSQPTPELLTYSYDPTNGAKSSGDVFRVKQ